MPPPRALLHLHAIPVVHFPFCLPVCAVPCSSTGAARRSPDPDPPSPSQRETLRVPNPHLRSPQRLAPPRRRPSRAPSADAHYNINPGTTLRYSCTQYLYSLELPPVPSNLAARPAARPLREAIFRPLALRPALYASPVPNPILRRLSVWTMSGYPAGYNAGGYAPPSQQQQQQQQQQYAGGYYPYARMTRLAHLHIG